MAIITILDNLGSHKTVGVRKAIKAADATLKSIAYGVCGSINVNDSAQQAECLNKLKKTGLIKIGL